MQSTQLLRHSDDSVDPMYSRLPVNSYSSCYWQDPAPHEFDNYHSTSKLPEHSDIVIIGAGLAGISTAYHLIQQDSLIRSQKTITILEARGLCSGATGRNGGHLRPDLYGQIPTYIRREGKAAAVELAEFEIAHVRAFKKFVQEEEISCDFTLTRTFDVWCNQDAAKKARQSYQSMVNEGVEYMDDVFFYDGKDAEQICGVKGALACASFTTGTMSTYSFVMHLTRKLLESGIVNIHTYTPVTAIKPAEEDGGYEIETPRGKLLAHQVIHANNAYVSALLPEYSNNIIPCKGICCQVNTPKGITPPPLTNPYITRAKDNTLSYLMQRPDGTVLVGGASSQFRPFREQWYDKTDDNVLIEAAKDFYVDFMQRTFRGWENSGAKVKQIWTGVMGYSYDSLPHVGEVPAKENQFILAGFNGHGTPVIWLAAKELAKMVARGIKFEDTELPRLFKTSQFRIDRARKGGESGGDIIGDGSAMTADD